MVKHTETIFRQIPDKLFECEIVEKLLFDHFARWRLKG